MNQEFPIAYYDKEADSKNELVHHLKLRSADIGKYIIMPGDPKRCKKIASYLDNVQFVADFREYATYTGYLDGTKISIVSHGIGGPSTAIAMEELIKLGAHTFIRVGTSGGMQIDAIPGEIVIVNGAIRTDNTPNAYTPIEVPSVPNYTVLKHLVKGAKKHSIAHHIGTVHCKDAFYAQHTPERMAISEQLLIQWKSYIVSGAIASEMESATLFAVAQSKGVRAGAVMQIVANQERRKIGLTEYTYDMKCAIQTVIEGLKLLIQTDNNNK